MSPVHLHQGVGFAAWALVGLTAAGCGAASSEPSASAAPPRVSAPAGFATFHDPQTCPATSACFLTKLDVADAISRMHSSLHLSQATVVTRPHARAHLLYVETGSRSGTHVTWTVWTHLAAVQPTPPPPPSELNQDGLLVMVSPG